MAVVLVVDDEVRIRDLVRRPSLGSLYPTWGGIESWVWKRCSSDHKACRARQFDRSAPRRD